MERDIARDHGVNRNIRIHYGEENSDFDTEFFTHEVKGRSTPLPRFVLSGIIQAETQAVRKNKIGGLFHLFEKGKPRESGVTSMSYKTWMWIYNNYIKGG